MLHWLYAILLSSGKTLHKVVVGLHELVVSKPCMSLNILRKRGLEVVLFEANSIENLFKYLESRLVLEVLFFKYLHSSASI